MSQEKIFLKSEADAWIQRNPSSMIAADPNDPVFVALAAIDLPRGGSLLDVGGQPGGLRRAFFVTIQGGVYAWWSHRAQLSRLAERLSRMLSLRGEVSHNHFQPLPVTPSMM